MVVMFIFGAHAFIWATTSRTVRMRAVPIELQGRVGSVYAVGVFGGIVVGQAVGGVIARVWGVTGPFWFAFVGSAVILALIWRQLALIAHADEHAVAAAETDPPVGPAT
jgi:predicted MFS family arabinose efflux permease